MYIWSKKWDDYIKIFSDCEKSWTNGMGIRQKI